MLVAVKVRVRMYLIDTMVISEHRKGSKANAGVRRFFKDAIETNHPLFISVITIGEIRRGIENLRHKQDKPGSDKLEKWLGGIVSEYVHQTLPFDLDMAQVWGRLLVPSPHHSDDKKIAATALIHDLTLVTRNVDDFRPIAALRLLNPFT